MSRLLKLWDNLRSSYWFLPSIMSLAAFLSAITATQNQWLLDPKLLDSIPWLYQSTPEGARSVMSTIAGSMITVAGVTFSITIASVAYATNQFGPRLLTNFMSDRGNQFTLGMFISTFLYCLLVLRTITNPDESGNSTGFVPHLAVVLGVGWAIASVGVLIYFIHHVPASIHASNVISSVGKQLMIQVDTLFPLQDADESPEGTRSSIESDAEAAQRPAPDLNTAHIVHSNFDGYVQFVDNEKIVCLAADQDGIVYLKAQPGDFVARGDILAWVCAKSEPDDAIFKGLCSAFLYDDRRTPAQDIMFLANELVEIAARALSPGTNDPFTAVNCMDWLSASLSLMSTRKTPCGDRYDVDDVLRSVSIPITYTTFLQDNVNRLRPYVATDRNAALHMQAVFGRLMLIAKDEKLLGVLLNLDEELITSAKRHLGQMDIANMEERHTVLASLSCSEKENVDITHRHRWLGGSI